MPRKQNEPVLIAQGVTEKFVAAYKAKMDRNDRLDLLKGLAVALGFRIVGPASEGCIYCGYVDQEMVVREAGAEVPSSGWYCPGCGAC